MAETGDNVFCALYIGSVARYVGGNLGPAVPLPRELEGVGDGAVGPFGRSWVSGQVEREGGFMRFVGAKGVWVWVPERSPEPCGRCVLAGPIWMPVGIGSLIAGGVGWGG